ncbi:MAG: bifunctional sugar-1-phosphate nucleotidylyltransferase/acetyltransferase [Thermoplasmatota archaeon]
MKAVILAAGEGTRLRPFTVSEPKVMISVANKPILQYVVESLVKNGITEIVMVVGYKRRKIMSYFGDGSNFNANIEYVFQRKQPSQGGTAHALYKAKEKIDEDFIVLPGDNVISEKTIKDLLKGMEKYTLLVTRSETPSKYGVCTLEDSEICDLIEKPEKSESNLISTGIYSFPSEIFDYIEDAMKERIYDLTTVVTRIMEERKVKGIISSSTWIDAVYPWDLQKVNSAALQGVPNSKEGVIEDNVMIKGNVEIGKGTIIRGGTYIEGPVKIGENCDIGPQACILPSTSIGDDSNISPFTVIKNSLLMKGIDIEPNSKIENSVIGTGVHIGSNFSTYLSDAEIISEHGLHEIENIGCMIAEDTMIGSGVTTESGVIIGSECRIKSGNVIRENIPSKTRVM